MADYQKYINALRKCAKEHENDKTFTGHVIVSDLCRHTANLLEELEQEPILDKIRAEIKQLPTKTRINWDGCLPDIDYPEIEYVDVTKNKLLSIINKYKAESGDEE